MQQLITIYHTEKQYCQNKNLKICLNMCLHSGIHPILPQLPLKKIVLIRYHIFNLFWLFLLQIGRQYGSKQILSQQLIAKYLQEKEYCVYIWAFILYYHKSRSKDFLSEAWSNVDFYTENVSNIALFQHILTIFNSQGFYEMCQNRSYHNNFSPYIYPKSSTVKLKN